MDTYERSDCTIPILTSFLIVSTREKTDMLRYLVVVILVGLCSAQNENLGEEEPITDFVMTDNVTEIMRLTANNTMESTTTTTAAATTTTTTTPPVTVPRETLASAPNAVVSEVGCLGFRALADITMFQQFSDGVWFNFTCQRPLIWDQSQCSCQARPVTIEDENCPHHRVLDGDQTQFQRRVHGEWLDTPIACPVNQIWSQLNCRCDWAPDGFQFPAVPVFRSGSQCFPLFNATFDSGIKDDGSSRQSIGRNPWQSVSLAPNAEGSNNGAARVKNGGLTLWFTASNDFGSTFQFKIRFRLTDGSVAAGETVALLTNPACNGGFQTFAMGYTPSSQTYSLFMRTLNKADTVTCTVTGEAYGWHTFGITYHKSLLTLTVDGSVCTTSDTFNSPLRPTSCVMSLGGFNFDGFIDDSVVRKVCVDPNDM